MSAAGPLIYAGGAILSAYNQAQAGKERGEAYDINAGIAESNASETLNLSAQQERQVRIIGRKAIGDIRANYGASGITGGSAFDVLAESMANVEADAQNIRHAGETKVKNLRREAELYRQTGTSARSSGRIGAVASLLTSAPILYNMIPTGGK